MRSLSKKITPYLFILPSMAFILLFYYYAMYLAVSNSFHDAFMGYKQTFIGFGNYKKIFSDEVFLTSFKNQAIITLSAAVSNLFFPFLAAELLHFIRRKNFSEAIKKIFVLPMLVPGIVTIIIWRYLYGNNYGFNSILQAIGLGHLRHDWLNDGFTAIWCVALVGFPFVSGLYFLILHAAINTIPSELYESAILDGCTTFDVVRHIHIPNLKPYFSLIFTLAVIGSLQNFGLIAATTNGGPGYDTMIPSMYMYLIAFSNNDLGYGSALGIFILFVIIGLTLISRRLTRSE